MGGAQRTPTPTCLRLRASTGKQGRLRAERRPPLSTSLASKAEPWARMTPLLTLVGGSKATVARRTTCPVISLESHRTLIPPVQLLASTGRLAGAGSEQHKLDQERPL